MNNRLGFFSSLALLRVPVFVLAASLGCFATEAGAADDGTPATTVFAEVVALEQPWWFNRLGASQPNGMMFALKRDVVSSNAGDDALLPGQVALRPDKRPRPIVLRVNVGQFLEIRFTNLLTDAPANWAGVHIAGLELASVADADGKVLPGIDNDATWVGKNNNAFTAPGKTRTYKYFAKAEGTFMLYSAAGDWNGQLAAGLFGAAVVEPQNAEWYRSQVTNVDLALAAYVVSPGSNSASLSVQARPDVSLVRQVSAAGEAREISVQGAKETLWSFIEVEADRQTVHKQDVIVRDGHVFSADGRPLVDYNAVYPPGNARAGQPILRMTQRRASGGVELIYSDLAAIITGPGGGAFPFTENGPDFYANPTYPGRRQPFREFAVMYHEIFATVQQAFPQFNLPQPLSNVLGAGADGFAINYGAAGISAEVLASRLGVGPMGGEQSVDLKFEEFFLSSWSNGDPAMVVDVPANVVSSIATGGAVPPTPTGTPSTSPTPPGERATKAFYPDDPSNVYHSYMRDHVTMRLLHTGQGITHVHHLHAHQWLRSPNSDEAHYLDSQMIAPGSTYTLEMVYNGSGNRNETAGDAIFHCHFYPHFAAGMWALWRVHDVFEAGTKLDANGIPLPGWNRALPDGEIVAGTPIPAIVPLPTLAMAPSPAPVQLIDNGTRVEVAAKDITPMGEPVYDNPGYPFFVPGVSGHRAPHPPIDFAWEESSVGAPKLDADGKKTYLDGGLPRHQVLDGSIVRELHTRWDFSKDFIAYDEDGKPIAGGLIAFELPEEGTAVEKAAMAAHSTRTHASMLPNGDPGNFTLNGLPPIPGAPYANPSVDDNGNGMINTRRYQAAAIQTDVALTKQGWHYPQQRMLTLWQDVAPTLKGERAPQPLFFRANTGETIEFWHTNLVPDYYDLDDFQVRTPTDILGQHIHLVKFDVLASDGAGNGWNYEDGTFSPDEVRGRIDALNLSGGIYGFDLKTQFKGTTQRKLTAKPAPAVFGEAPVGQNWLGTQTTIQRWDTDPVENNQGEDRTLRTVFTHDHFGPSTHQQVGLYGGLLVEPEGSKWYDPIAGGLLYDTSKRSDGGPTSWQANIVTADPADSYREFALEFADFQLAYTAGSPSKRSAPTAPLFTTCTEEALMPGPVSSTVRSTFADNGVVLAPNAKIVQSGSDLLLTSATAPGVNNNYTLLAAPAPAGTKYQVTPPSSDTTDQPFAACFPQALTPGPITVSVDMIFAVNGVSLASNATVIASTAGFSVSNPISDTQAVVYTLTPLWSSASAVYQVIPVDGPPSWSAPQFAISPPGADPVNQVSGAPFPTLISTPPAPGSFALNYRAEPIPARVWDPNNLVPASGRAGDLSFAYASITRADPLLNVQPVPGTPINPADPGGFTFPANITPTINGPAVAPIIDNAKVQPTDPFTPMLRAYAGDKVQIRTLVGAHHNPHFFSVDGVKWLYEPESSNTGFRNNQQMGISEHYEMLFQLPNATAKTDKPFADHLYNASAGTDGITNGLWGLMRSYKQSVDQLVALPNNTPPARPTVASIQPPAGAKKRSFKVVATTAKQALGGALVYNNRGQVTGVNPVTFDSSLKISDPDALIYFRAEDLTSPNAKGKLKPGVPIEPLILRAAAGEWIELTLINAFSPPKKAPTLVGALPPYGNSDFFVIPAQSGAAFTIDQTVVDQFKAAGYALSLTATVSPPSTNPVGWTISPPATASGAADMDYVLTLSGDSILVSPTIMMRNSLQVGLNPQVVGYDITRGDGLNVGFNATVSVAPGKTSAPIYWYAGTIEYDQNGGIKTTPVELGAINLNPSDPLLQHTHGLVGALVIEPEGSRWKEDKSMRAAATVTKADGSTFRDFVLISQDDLSLTFGQNSTSNAVNYRTEPMSYRFANSQPDTNPTVFPANVSAATSNVLVGNQDPQTPIYTAPAGSEVRFRMLHPASGNGADGETLTIDGHVFQEEPYTNDSRTIGFNPLSQWFGTRGGHGARDRFEVVLASAGGEHKVPGDYLYRSLISLGGSDFVAGKWGIFRVEGPTPPRLSALAATSGVLQLPTATTVEAAAESPIAKRFRNRTKTFKERTADAPESKD